MENIKGDITEFHHKFGACRLENENEENEFIAGAEDVLNRCEPIAKTEEERHELAKFCNFLGCWLLVYTYRLKEGRKYYHKALELFPDSFDIRWEYYTTLEEIVEDEEQCTPEFIRDAIECLRFCIDYCDTPELKRENHIEYRWLELGRIYMKTGDYSKAKECAERSMNMAYINSEREMAKVGEACEMIAKADKMLGGKGLKGFFNKIFSFFRRKNTKQKK